MEATTTKLVETTKKDIDEKWIQVVAKQKTIIPPQEAIMTTTLEENQRRKARALNIRVAGLLAGDTSKQDAMALCHVLEVEGILFEDAWRIGKDMTRDRPLILKFSDEASKKAFLAKRCLEGKNNLSRRQPNPHPTSTLQGKDDRGQ